MAFGRNKSHRRKASGDTLNDVRRSVKISKDDQDKLKVRTINVHDPILNAVNEQQPFQEAGMDFRKINSLSMMLSHQKVVDIFGNPVVKPDVSNPTRSRDERPMDTIRSFEYSITKDDFYRTNLETPVYGWGVRPSYPLLPQNRRNNPTNNVMPSYNSNPYDNSNSAVPRSASQQVDQPVYNKPVAKPVAPKRKSRWFRKNKA